MWAFLGLSDMPKSIKNNKVALSEELAKVL